MASMNYATWYLVKKSDELDTQICKTETDRDECISAMCRKIADMQCVNSDRPTITIRVDRHSRPNGPLM